MNQEPPSRNGKPAQAQVTILEDELQSHPGFAQIFAFYVAGVHARLQSNPPARVADIGCGSGLSSIEMALAYPKVRVDGYDTDEASIEQAWANARQASVADRVTFHVRNVSDDTLNGRYDLLTAFQSIHGMAKPVGVLKVMRRLAGKDGVVIVVADHLMAEVLERYAKEAGFQRVEILAMDSVCLPRPA